MAVFFKVMDKEHITRMIDLKNGNWHHLNTMTSDKRKDASIYICMYVCIISFIYMYIEPIRMYVAVTSLLLFIPVERKVSTGTLLSTG